jgi:hypothetical protein
MKEKGETKNEYEYKHLRICEKWLQIESCRKCLLEILCNYEKIKNELQRNSQGDWEENQIS